MPRSSDTEKQLAALLDQGHTFTLSEVAARLSITERHARRLLQQLREDGVPIRERREKGFKHFYLEEKDRRQTTPLIPLSPEEALALSVAAGTARAMLGSTPLEVPLASGFQRLVYHLAPHIDWVDLDAQQDRWYFGAIAGNRIDPNVFSTLLEGLEHQRSVRIDYAKPDAPSTDRKIDPLCFAVVGNAVLLTGYCHQRRRVLDFALTRITCATLCDPATDTQPYFDRPVDFHPARHYADQRFGALTGDTPQVFRLLVESEVAHLFREREYHASQDIEDDEREDGRLVVSYEFSSVQDFRSFAQSFGMRVTVLEPPELVEQMRLEAEILARRYATPPGTP